MSTLAGRISVPLCRVWLHAYTICCKMSIYRLVFCWKKYRRIRSSYVTHHIGAWMHRPTSILIAPHRDNGKREDNDILIAQVALRIKIASLCRASNLLRRIFIINKSYLNKRILFNSFTYMSVCVCLPSLAPTLPHNWRCGTGSWSCEIRILPQIGDGNLYRGSSRRFNVYYHGTYYVKIGVHLQAEIHPESLKTN